MEKTTEKKTKGKIMTGKVISSRNGCTIVEISRFIKHSKYRKFYKVSKKFKAADKAENREVGSTVSIVGCRPISKDKRFRVI